MRILPTTISGPITRVIGSLDFKGQGTTHILPHVNPFVLLDEAPVITEPNIPKFGIHPHSGAMIVTICLSGYIENIYYSQGVEKKEVHGPGPFLLAVNSGRGMVHDEHTGEDKPTKLLQLAWMTGDDTSDAELFCQNNPVILEEDDGVKIMLCAGSFRQMDSGIPCKQNQSLTVLYITLPPGGTFQTDEFVNQDGIFIYSLDDNNNKIPLWVNGKKVLESSHALVDILPDDEFDCNTIKIENREEKIANCNGDDDKDVKVLMGFGRPLENVWTKMLMHNGFIFSRTEDDAENKKLEFEEFGVSHFGSK